MIMECTHDEYYDMLSVPVIIELVLLLWNMRCIILVDIIQTLICFTDWSNASMRQDGAPECRSSMDQMGTSQ